jgi:hypothetical protein
MKKNSRASAKAADDMRPEYRFDYGQSRPNRFAATFGTGKVAVVLEADVASVFRTSEAVNRLLRSVIAAFPEKARSGEIRRRKKTG